MTIAREIHVAPHDMDNHRTTKRPPSRRRSAAIGLAAAALLVPALAFGQVSKESNCSDGKDEDGDTVLDCGDADCFADAACKPDGNPENTEARCGDWVDNDSDGKTDCDDSDCTVPGINACKGSAQLPIPVAPPSATNPAASTPGQSPASQSPAGQAPPAAANPAIGIAAGDGTFGPGDIDGERNDISCSDGVDNDGDGKTDCEDFGCRYDQTVTICQGSPDLRFSVVARVEQFMTLKSTALEDEMARETPGQEVDPEYPISDARFSRLQLRAFGPLPFVEDSFYLLSSRFERTPRLTFAMFQIPIGSRGDYVNLNSGGGGISNSLVRSAHKRLLLDAPFYLYNAFEQGNGAALEIGGPIDKQGKLLYRTFIAGGSGQFSGNVGGRFVNANNENFAFSAGAQLHYNVVGYYSRWDSPMLFTPSATKFGFEVGLKYDQRPAERYPSINVNAVLRHRRLIAVAEFYGKYELDFETFDYAYNLQLGILLLPRKLLLAVDFGEFITETPGLDKLPEDFDIDDLFDLKRQETQARVALHYYLWRNVLVGSVLFVERCQDPDVGGVMFEADSPVCSESDEVLRELRFAATYRF